jgi:predicted dehydrogenase
MLDAADCGGVLDAVGLQGQMSPAIDYARDPDKYRWVPEGVPSGSPYNVAQLYRRLAEGIRAGKSVSPGFDAAVTRHRLLDLITRASDTGIKQTTA